eukprot:scaffold43759_cov28-Tisochrysis_lutea.AAC.3
MSLKLQGGARRLTTKMPMVAGLTCAVRCVVGVLTGPSPLPILFPRHDAYTAIADPSPGDRPLRARHEWKPTLVVEVVRREPLHPPPPSAPVPYFPTKPTTNEALLGRFYRLSLPHGK